MTVLQAAEPYTDVVLSEAVGRLGTFGETDVARSTRPAKSPGLATVTVEGVDDAVPARPRLTLPGFAEIAKLSERVKEYVPQPLVHEMLAKYVPPIDAVNAMPFVAPTPLSCRVCIV
jgi:hypothetical protein